MENEFLVCKTSEIELTTVHLAYKTSVFMTFFILPLPYLINRTCFHNNTIKLGKKHIKIIKRMSATKTFSSFCSYSVSVPVFLHILMLLVFCCEIYIPQNLLPCDISLQPASIPMGCFSTAASLALPAYQFHIFIILEILESYCYS